MYTARGWWTAKHHSVDSVAAAATRRYSARRRCQPHIWRCRAKICCWGRSSRSDHVMPSPQHPQPGQVEQLGQLPPAPLGNPHGYERMAALSDAERGLTLQNLTENVSSALAIPKKSAGAHLAAKRSADESGRVTGSEEPVKCSQVGVDNRTNILLQGLAVITDENTICIPKTRSEPRSALTSQHLWWHPPMPKCAFFEHFPKPIPPVIRLCSQRTGKPCWLRSSTKL